MISEFTEDSETEDDSPPSSADVVEKLNTGQRASTFPQAPPKLARESNTNLEVENLETEGSTLSAQRTVQSSKKIKLDKSLIRLSKNPSKNGISNLKIKQNPNKSTAMLTKPRPLVVQNIKVVKETPLYKLPHEDPKQMKSVKELDENNGLSESQLLDKWARDFKKRQKEEKVENPEKEPEKSTTEELDWGIETQEVKVQKVEKESLNSLRKAYKEIVNVKKDDDNESNWDEESVASSCQVSYRKPKDKGIKELKQALGLAQKKSENRTNNVVNTQAGFKETFEMDWDDE